MQTFFGGFLGQSVPLGQSVTISPSPRGIPNHELERGVAYINQHKAVHTHTTCQTHTTTASSIFGATHFGGGHPQGGHGHAHDLNGNHMVHLKGEKGKRHGPINVHQKERGLPLHAVDLQLGRKGQRVLAHTQSYGPSLSGGLELLPQGPVQQVEGTQPLPQRLEQVVEGSHQPLSQGPEQVQGPHQHVPQGQGACQLVGPHQVAPGPHPLGLPLPQGPHPHRPILIHHPLLHGPHQLQGPHGPHQLHPLASGPHPFPPGPQSTRPHELRQVSHGPHALLPQGSPHHSLPQGSHPFPSGLVAHHYLPLGPHPLNPQVHPSHTLHPQIKQLQQSQSSQSLPHHPLQTPHPHAPHPESASDHVHHAHTQESNAPNPPTNDAFSPISESVQLEKTLLESVLECPLHLYGSLLTGLTADEDKADLDVTAFPFQHGRFVDGRFAHGSNNIQYHRSTKVKLLETFAERLRQRPELYSDVVVVDRGAIVPVLKCKRKCVEEIGSQERVACWKTIRKVVYPEGENTGGNSGENTRGNSGSSSSSSSSSSYEKYEKFNSQTKRIGLSDKVGLSDPNAGEMEKDTTNPNDTTNPDDNCNTSSNSSKSPSKIRVTPSVLSPNSRSIDITIANENGLKNSYLLRSYAQFPLLKQLVIRVKEWAQRHNLVRNSTNGLLSSYAYTLLVIAWLINPGCHGKKEGVEIGAGCHGKKEGVDNPDRTEFTEDTSGCCDKKGIDVDCDEKGINVDCDEKNKDINVGCATSTNQGNVPHDHDNVTNQLQANTDKQGQALISSCSNPSSSCGLDGNKVDGKDNVDSKVVGNKSNQNTEAIKAIATPSKTNLMSPCSSVHPTPHQLCRRVPDLLCLDEDRMLSTDQKSWRIQQIFKLAREGPKEGIEQAFVDKAFSDFMRILAARADLEDGGMPVMVMSLRGGGFCYYPESGGMVYASGRGSFCAVEDPYAEEERYNGHINLSCRVPRRVFLCDSCDNRQGDDRQNKLEQLGRLKDAIRRAAGRQSNHGQSQSSDSSVSVTTVTTRGEGDGDRIVEEADSTLGDRFPSAIGGDGDVVKSIGGGGDQPQPSQRSQPTSRENMNKGNHIHNTNANHDTNHNDNIKENPNPNLWAIAQNQFYNTVEYCKKLAQGNIELHERIEQLENEKQYWEKLKQENIELHARNIELHARLESSEEKCGYLEKSKKLVVEEIGWLLKRSESGGDVDGAVDGSGVVINREAEGKQKTEVSREGSERAHCTQEYTEKKDIEQEYMKLEEHKAEITVLPPDVTIEDVTKEPEPEQDASFLNEKACARDSFISFRDDSETEETEVHGETEVNSQQDEDSISSSRPKSNDDADASVTLTPVISPSTHIDSDRECYIASSTSTNTRCEDGRKVFRDGKTLLGFRVKRNTKQKQRRRPMSNQRTSSTRPSLFPSHSCRSGKSGKLSVFFIRSLAAKKANKAFQGQGETDLNRSVDRWSMDRDSRRDRKKMLLHKNKGTPNKFLSELKRKEEKSYTNEKLQSLQEEKNYWESLYKKETLEKETLVEKMTSENRAEKEERETLERNFRWLFDDAKAKYLRQICSQRRLEADLKDEVEKRREAGKQLRSLIDAILPLLNEEMTQIAETIGAASAIGAANTIGTATIGTAEKEWNVEGNYGEGNVEESHAVNSPVVSSPDETPESNSDGMDSGDDESETRDEGKGNGTKGKGKENDAHQEEKGTKGTKGKGTKGKGKKGKGKGKKGWGKVSGPPPPESERKQAIRWVPKRHGEEK